MTWLLAKLASIIAVIGATMVTLFAVKRGAKKEADFEARLKDQKNANDIKDRAAAVADERVHDNEIGYRD